MTSEERIRELEAENERLRREVEARDRRIDELVRRIEKLEEQLRKSHRQTRRFERRTHTGKRRAPGRSAGHPGAHAAVPDHVDEEAFAALRRCPDCGGDELGAIVDCEQFVIDLPVVRPHVRRIVTQRGFCACCRKAVRSTHPWQVSRAGGAARVSVGPRALGFAAELKHRLGVPYRDVADVFSAYFGLKLTHGAFVHASARLARRAKPTYDALVHEVRGSPVVHTDDTGWRIDRDSAWLWVFATPEITVYRVERRRGAGVVTDVLGEDFRGWLVSDGLPALDRLDKVFLFRRAQCLAHPLRRAAEMEEEQRGGAVAFPHAVKHMIKDAVALSHRTDLRPSTRAEYARRIERRMDALLAGRHTHRENRKLADHLAAHRDQLFICLYDSAVPPTNNLAEQELRGAVVTRKIGGCNRSDVHAEAHAIVASVAQTAHRNGLTLTDFVIDWLGPNAPEPAATLKDLKRKPAPRRDALRC